MSSKYFPKSEMKIYNKCVRPIMTYVAETRSKPQNPSFENRDAGVAERVKLTASGVPT